MQIFKFEPIYKETIWGGDKLAKIKGIKSTNLGESWEISSLEGNESIVSDGPDKGLTITQLIDKYKADLVGEECYNKYGNKFPILVKYIDAKEDLSIQVHPNDKIAQELEGKSGKTELWYIVDCEDDADIIIGHKQNVTKEDILKGLREDSILEFLNVVPIKKGDCFYIPAGTIHAIRKGTIIAEIQQASDITYRLYDYNRIDINGKLRNLHINKALKSVDFNNRLLNNSIYNKYFSIKLLEINSNHIFLCRKPFYFFLCLEGSFIAYNENKNHKISISQGESFLLKSINTKISILGSTKIMIISL